MAYKKAFIDSDILLDVLLKREPHVVFGRVLLESTTQNLTTLYTSSLILANVHYLVAKNSNKQLALDALKYIMKFAEILSFDKTHVSSAIKSNHIDFEDTIQYQIAQHNDCDLIISRNIKHYKRFDIPVLTAEQFLRTIL